MEFFRKGTMERSMRYPTITMCGLVFYRYQEPDLHFVNTVNAGGRSSSLLQNFISRHFAHLEYIKLAVTTRQFVVCISAQNIVSTAFLITVDKYSMSGITVDKDAFFRRMKTLYDAWKVSIFWHFSCLCFVHDMLTYAKQWLTWHFQFTDMHNECCKK